MVLVAKNLPANTGDTRGWVQPLGQEEPLEEGMTAHSRVLAWRIPWKRSLAGYSPWGHRELDTTACLHHLCLVLGLHTGFHLSFWELSIFKAAGGRRVRLGQVIATRHFTQIQLFFLFLAVPYDMWDLSSPTSDRTYISCIGSMESQLQDFWGSPLSCFHE